MKKSTQNIVLGIILVILLGCSIITGLAIRNNSGVIFDVNANEETKFAPYDSNNGSTVDVNRNDRRSKARFEENNTRPDKPTNSNRPTDSNRPSNGNRRSLGNDRNDFMKDDFNNLRMKSNFKHDNDIDLYLILYGIENVLIGAIVMYLVLLNVRDDKKGKIKFLKD